MTGSRPGGCGFLQSGPRPLPWILPPLRNPEIRRRQGKHWPGLCNLGILQGCSSPVAHDSSLTTISSPGYLPPQIGEGQANLGREVTVSSLGTQHLFLGAPPAMVAGTFSAVPCLPRHVPSWARPDAGGAPCVSPQSHLAPQWQASFSPGPLGPWRNVQVSCLPKAYAYSLILPHTQQLLGIGHGARGTTDLPWTLTGSHSRPCTPPSQHLL